MPDLNAAVSEAERIAADPRHGYSQPNRDGIDYDCSSLVCRCLRSTGFAMPSYNFSTRSMGQWLQTHGWSWHAGLDGVRRGDVLWKTGHTAFATSAGGCVEALMSETRGIHGRSGDQTGWEIRTAPINYTNWAGYWRYDAAPAEEEDEVTEAEMQRIAELAAAKVWEHTSGKETYDRVRRSTQILKIMCGMGADSMAEPKACEQDLHDWTIGRWQRCTAMLKSLLGIAPDDMQSTEPTGDSPLALSDDDVERIAERVAELLGER